MTADRFRRARPIDRRTPLESRRVAWIAGLVLAGLVWGAPAAARAQLFFASRPEPPFSIGPLMIRASVAEGDTVASIHVLWSLVIPASARPEDVAQDLFLLWPGEVKDSGSGGGKPDQALMKRVEELGFTVVGDGHLDLFAQSLSERDGHPTAERQPNGASFVVFVQEGAALGLSPPATFVRIPWSARERDGGWLMELRLRISGLIKPKKSTWAEELFVGGRYLFTMSFNEVRDRPLFPMYFANRDRVVRLADAPAELVVSFSHSDRLKIDDTFPPSAIRRLSETEESTEVVSLFLDKTDGITPQHLAVQFGYFSKVQAWALILIPATIFALGQAIGPMIGRTAVGFLNAVGSRIHLGRWNAVPRPRQTGVILPRSTLQRIVPGATTRDEVIRLCGPDMEQHEQFPASQQRALIYQGQLLVPKPRRVFGWISTVDHWEAEKHEVRIDLDGEVVKDVHAEIRFYRPAAPTAE